MQQATLFDGKYRILRTLGRGGTGSVFLAENVRLGTLWAIKEVHKKQGEAIHFLTEPHVLKNLKHPALPRIFDVIENDETLYLVQDYIEGATLEALIQLEGPQPESKVVQWASEICDVYAYLHGQRPNPIIYRDMKPGNLIVDQQGHIKLIDFGIAREFKSDSPNDTVCLGTRGYAAPEQYGTSQTDSRSDIYSLGVTLCHALTGKGPNDPPYGSGALSEMDGAWNAELCTVIQKAMRTDPGQRFQTASEMQEALDRIGSASRPVDKDSQSSLIRKSAAVGVGLAGFLFTLGGLKALVFTALSDTLVKTKGLLELVPGLLLLLLCYRLWTGRLPWQQATGGEGILQLDSGGRLKTPIRKALAFFSPLSTGKTELACNAARALAQMGKRVILLDMDHETWGTVYNFPVDPGEQGENYYKYRLMVRKISGYLAGTEPEISNEEIAQLALWREKSLSIYSGNQEVPLEDDTGALCVMEPEVFRYLMRRLRALADVVVIDVGRNTPPELLTQITALEDCTKYMVASESLKDLNAWAYRHRLPRDMDYEDWILVVNQCLPQATVPDYELRCYFSNPALDWMKYKIAAILRVPRIDALWRAKWSRQTVYGQDKGFDNAITEIIAAAKSAA